MISGTVTIHLIRPAVVTAVADLETLTPLESRRAEAFRFPQDAAHWISCRAALRRILGVLTGLPPGAVPIQSGSSGKPFLATPFDHIHFNLSHCRDLALIAICADGPVGIDLEPLDRAPSLCGCESSFCHPRELLELPDDDTRPLRLLEIWTAKEALLKAIGTGFSTAPETIGIQHHGDFLTATADHPLACLAGNIIRRPRHPALDGYLAAVSTPLSVLQFRFVDSQGSTPARDSAINPCDS